MISEIKDIILNKEQQELCKSERAEVIKQLYEIYTSEHERILRKKENWKRYIKYLKENKTPHTLESLKTFKKKSNYIKEQPVKSFCFFLSHIPTKHLYFIRSEMLDYKNRGKSASAYLFASIKIK
jgi:hypothetical protein